jgi:hypothetical protein
MKNLKKVLPVLLVFIIAFFGGCANKPDNNNGNAAQEIIFHSKEFPAMLSEDLTITKAFNYDGEFPEDGTFKQENDVFALKVVNNSDKTIQLVRIYVTTDKNECLFEITTLPGKKTVTVFEKNAYSLSEDEKILEIREENKIFFEQSLSLNRDKFEITTLDSVLNIKNISQQDVTSNVYVYFKKKDADGNYFGGITFRSNAGGLKAGEFKQIPAPHFSKADSEVLFVDYGMQ